MESVLYSRPLASTFWSLGTEEFQTTLISETALFCKSVARLVSLTDAFLNSLKGHPFNNW